MKLKYRIIEYTFPISDSLYSSQYKLLGFWMNVDRNLTGHFLFRKSCYLYSYPDAFLRVNRHKDLMGQSKYWWSKNKIIHKV